MNSKPIGIGTFFAEFDDLVACFKVEERPAGQKFSKLMSDSLVADFLSLAYSAISLDEASIVTYEDGEIDTEVKHLTLDSLLSKVLQCQDVRQEFQVTTWLLGKSVFSFGVNRNGQSSVMILAGFEEKKHVDTMASSLKIAGFENISLVNKDALRQLYLHRF